MSSNPLATPHHGNGHLTLTATPSALQLEHAARLHAILAVLEDDEEANALQRNRTARLLLLECMRHFGVQA